MEILPSSSTRSSCHTARPARATCAHAVRFLSCEVAGDERLERCTDRAGRRCRGSVLDALVRAVVVTDPDGQILLWNRSAEELYGWAEHEVLGRSILDVLAPDDEFAANHQDLKAVAGGTVMSGDRLVTRRDGQLLRVMTFTRPMLDESGTTIALVGSSEDVGALRDAEQQARDLSEHFHSALEAGGLGTWRWNMKTGETVWDARLEALFGLSPGEFDGTFDTYVSLLHPDDREDAARCCPASGRVEIDVPRRAPGDVAGRIGPLDRRCRWRHARRERRSDRHRRLLDGHHRARGTGTRTAAPRGTSPCWRPRANGCSGSVSSSSASSTTR